MRREHSNGSGGGALSVKKVGGGREADVDVESLEDESSEDSDDKNPEPSDSGLKTRSSSGKC